MNLPNNQITERAIKNIFRTEEHLKSIAVVAIFQNDSNNPTNSKFKIFANF